MNDTHKRKLPIKHAGSPLVTNGYLNLKAAMKCNTSKAHMTAKQIADEWPEVFRCKGGKLSQKYDYELADGSGRYETNRLITRKSVASAIRRYTRINGQKGTAA